MLRATSLLTVVFLAVRTRVNAIKATSEWLFVNGGVCMRWLTIVMALIALSGCANKIDYNKASLNLAIGMSKTDVQGVMGAPRRTDVNTDRERWIYWNPVMVGFTPIDNEQLSQDRLVVTFVENKVTKWGKQTIADDISENTQKLYQQARDNQQKAILKQQ